MISKLDVHEIVGFTWWSGFDSSPLESGSLTPTRAVILWRDKGMLKGWLYDWEGMATMGRQNLETRFG